MRFTSLATFLAVGAAVGPSPDPKSPPQGPSHQHGHDDGNNNDGGGSGESDFELTHTYVTRTMSYGDSEVLWQNGPMTVTLACDTRVDEQDSYVSNMRIDIMVQNEGEATIFAYYDTDSGGGSTLITPGNSWHAPYAWYVAWSGNNIDDGAVRLSTGHYFALDGETTIGYFHKARDDDYDDTPFVDITPNSDCGFSGVLVTAVPKNSDYSDPYASNVALAESDTKTSLDLYSVMAGAGVGAVVASVMTAFLGMMFLLPKQKKEEMISTTSLDRSTTPLQVELERVSPRGNNAFNL